MRVGILDWRVGGHVHCGFAHDGNGIARFASPIPLHQILHPDITLAFGQTSTEHSQTTHYLARSETPTWSIVSLPIHRRLCNRQFRYPSTYIRIRLRILRSRTAAATIICRHTFTDVHCLPSFRLRFESLNQNSTDSSLRTATDPTSISDSRSDTFTSPHPTDATRTDHDPASTAEVTDEWGSRYDTYSEETERSVVTWRDPADDG